jgi:hypothetical protein
MFGISLGMAMGMTVSYASSDTLPKLMGTPSKAGKIMEKAYRYLGSLDHFAFTATLTNEDVYEKKMVVELTHRVSVKLDRPSRLRVDIIGDSRNRSYFLNEGKLTTYARDYGLYGQIEIPENIDDALDYTYEHYKIETPLANILYSDIYERLRPKTKGVYFGMAFVNGILCDYIGFTNAKKSFQVWVQKGDRPLIRKFVIIDKTTPMRLHSTTVIDWQEDSEISPEVFTFNPPENAYKIDMVPPQGGRK